MKQRGDIQASLNFFAEHAPPRGSTILDIGTRYGTFLHRLWLHGYVRYGIDVNHETLEEGRKLYPGISLWHYGGHKLPFDDNSFDCVTMFDVIEHIPDVAEYMQEVHRVLKPNGRLIFQTPNKWWNAPWELCAHGKAWADRHCSLQSYRSLWNLLREAGFSTPWFSKRSPDTPFKRQLAREKGGWFALCVLWVVAWLPLPMPWRTSFWGHCYK